jgi:hypothetical protein
MDGLANTRTETVMMDIHALLILVKKIEDVLTNMLHQINAHLMQNAKLTMIANNMQQPENFQRNASLQFVTKLSEDVSLKKELTPLVFQMEHAKNAIQLTHVKPQLA